MKDVKTRWAVYDDGLKIWFNGELVAKIDPSEFKHMVSDLALWLRHNDAVDVTDSELVLDVGSGYGYSAAIIAHLAEAVVALESEDKPFNEMQNALIDHEIGRAHV